MDLNRYLDRHGVRAGRHCPLCTIEEYLIRTIEYMEVDHLVTRRLHFPFFISLKVHCV